MVLKRKQLAPAAVLCVGLGGAIFALVKNEILSPLKNYHAFRRSSSSNKTPNTKNTNTNSNHHRRQLAMARINNVAGEGCQWQPPHPHDANSENVPNELRQDFYKTVIAGFPNGEKEAIFMQMEALTGLPAKDEWDFEFRGMTNHPFINANYPHHHGVWGWGNVAEQAIILVPNIRTALAEYPDRIWNIGSGNEGVPDLGPDAPPIEEFFAWRDMRIMDEVHWYGWFIDYWMEEGLMRDVYTHKITTPEHWYMLLMPTLYTRDDLNYDMVVGPASQVTPSYDTHCVKGDIQGGCEARAVVSAEKLRQYETGLHEMEYIVNALLREESGIAGKFQVTTEAWDCIWKELHGGVQHMQQQQQPQQQPQRSRRLQEGGPPQGGPLQGGPPQGGPQGSPEGAAASGPEGAPPSDGQAPPAAAGDAVPAPADQQPQPVSNFGQEILEEMLRELDRLISKYYSPEWNEKPTAQRLVELFVEQRAHLTQELNEVSTGLRKLSDRDYLGPRERRRRAQLKEHEVLGESIDYSAYFTSMEHQVKSKKLHDMRQTRLSWMKNANIM